MIIQSSKGPDVRSRMQLLKDQISTTIDRLPYRLLVHVFVAICRGYWNRMGQDVLGFSKNRKDNRVWYKGSKITVAGTKPVTPKITFQEPSEPFHPSWFLVQEHNFHSEKLVEPTYLESAEWSRSITESISFQQDTSCKDIQKCVFAIIEMGATSVRRNSWESRNSDRDCSIDGMVSKSG
ncbi:hypothetical protein IFM89_027540 [Coptis chinensis]|uniref:Uncharacterized protein n=1 Tax=Coptis chinensis TaxID=261450 RepID=A0A835LWW0_9MAGN|nr:hypothetical protein IFM89_027540 [Coptis chinensis]